EGDTVYLVDMWKGPQIGGLAFNDSSGGDGDGILEDGETIQFAVTLDNLHEEALSDISAELSVSGPPLNVTVGSASFSDMAVGGSVDNAATPFEFDIPNGCGRQVATFSLTITWTSNYGTKVQTLSFDKSTGEASVLLVDDDLAGNDVDLYYRLALLYTDSTYDVWNASWGTPQAAHLGEYDMVIWFTGDHRSNLLTPDEIITIKAYLDAGGNLLLSGQGIAGQLDTTDADFLHNYLRCEYVKTSYYPYLAAQPGAQVFDASVALKIDGSGGADNQSVLDHIDPINGGVAELQYWGKPNSGAVSYSGDYRLLFLSFGFEAIINGDAQWTERDVVFPQMMAYFEWINPLFCCEVRADLDFDGLGPDIADLVFLVDYMFSGGGVPPCWQASDIDANGAGPDIADLVYLVDYMFAGGPPPPICL
ncbi:MAG: hypothetical protein OEV80_18300, partial [candidate division Zixibacteria bacterium]|nr:hypothetical protein [candidate division Zixibacteria bacterium]